MHYKSTILTTEKTAFPHLDRGMSLIELLVVLTILGILAVIVVPSFQSQVIQARRGHAINTLLQIKIQQEAYRMEHISYASTLQLLLSNTDFYAFSVSNETATTFTITATAIGTQKEDTKCITMSIDQSMNKTPMQCFK